MIWGGFALLLLVLYLGVVLRFALTSIHWALRAFLIVLILAALLWFMAESLQERIEEIKRGDDDAYRDY